MVLPRAWIAIRALEKTRLSASTGLLGTGEARADAAREEFGDEFDDFVSAPLATLIHFIKRCFHLPPEKLEEIEDFNLAPLGKSSAKRAERGPRPPKCGDAPRLTR